MTDEHVGPTIDVSIRAGDLQPDDPLDDEFVANVRVENPDAKLLLYATPSAEAPSLRLTPGWAARRRSCFG